VLSRGRGERPLCGERRAAVLRGRRSGGAGLVRARRAGLGLLARAAADEGRPAALAGVGPLRRVKGCPAEPARRGWNKAAGVRRDIGLFLIGRESAGLDALTGRLVKQRGRKAAKFGLPGPGGVVGGDAFAQIVDRYHDAMFQPEFGRLPGGLVGGGDEGEEAIRVVVFFAGDEDGELVGLVVVGGPGEGGWVEDGGEFGHCVGDCSAKGGGCSN
jgi:hypothetical protein